MMPLEVVLTLIQRVLSAKHRSTRYWVTGVPPSLVGTAHVSEIDAFNASATASFSGAPGTSARINITLIDKTSVATLP